MLTNMDSIGWAVEEFFGLSDMGEELKEIPRWKRISRIIALTLISALFLAFVGYQIYLIAESYKNPAWTSEEVQRQSIPYPGIIVCPSINRFSKYKKMTSRFCEFYAGNTSDNVTTGCRAISYDMVITIEGTETSLNTSCLVYNFHSKLNSTGVDSFMIIDVNVTIKQKNNHKRENVTQLDFPIYLQFYDASTQIPNKLNPDLLFAINSNNYVILSRTEYQYMSGYNKGKTFVAQYDGLVSSAPGDYIIGNSIKFWFSFTTNRVVVWTQIINYDVITVLGIIAGFVGFARSCYSLFFLIVDKIHNRYLKKKEDEENKLNLELEEEKKGKGENDIEKNDNETLRLLPEGSKKKATSIND